MRLGSDDNQEEPRFQVKLLALIIILRVPARKNEDTG